MTHTMTARSSRPRNPLRSRRAPEPCGCGVLASREIDAMLASGSEIPTITRIAGRLSMNVRALQRRLGDEGLLFRDLLSECRHRRAIEALAAGRLPIAAIAKQLGYSDSAHFARAFRAWTGLTPSGYKRRIARKRGPPR